MDKSKWNLLCYFQRFAAIENMNAFVIILATAGEEAQRLMRICIDVANKDDANRL